MVGGAGSAVCWVGSAFSRWVLPLHASRVAIRVLDSILAQFLGPMTICSCVATSLWLFRRCIKDMIVLLYCCIFRVNTGQMQSRSGGQIWLRSGNKWSQLFKTWSNLKGSRDRRSHCSSRIPIHLSLNPPTPPHLPTPPSLGATQACPPGPTSPPASARTSSSVPPAATRTRWPCPAGTGPEQPERAAGPSRWTHGP